MSCPAQNAAGTTCAARTSVSAMLRCQTELKDEIPNSNTQHVDNIQIPSSQNPAPRFGGLEVEAFLEFGCWFLVIANPPLPFYGFG